MFRIHNQRMGFATNSSSSHSIIYVPPEHTMPWNKYSNGERTYGWENFTLVTAEEKRDYISTQLYLFLQRIGVPYTLVRSYFAQRFGWQFLPPNYANLDYDDEPTIDHQSVANQVVSYDSFSKTQHLDERWVEDLETFIINNDRVAILGGNDNDEGHPMLEANYITLLPYFDIPGSSVARRDAPGLWTFFNKENGHKVTIDLDPTRTERPKSKFPELVDIKITDYCPYGCAFCYQGSTVEGKHAAEYDLRRLFEGLAAEQVFEIAFGGGEPTLHPEFINILKSARAVGIIPSFTTRNLSFFRNRDQCLEVLPLVGGIAYSADNAGQVRLWGLVAQKYGGNTGYAPNKFVVHVVLGAQDMGTTLDMLREAKTYNLHVTLLGYKTNNRGGTYKPHDYSNIVEELQDLISQEACPSISIDTALASTHGSQFEATGFDQSLFYTEEGKHSCYIDAVNGLVGPSSYADQSSLIEYKNINSIKKWWDPTLEADDDY